MERLICLAVGYVCGLFQTGYLVGKFNHVDIRKQGSGNAGTTRYLENKIREAFGFRGTSLRFFIRERKEKEQ